MVKLILIAALSDGCVEPFYPELEGVGQTLIIEGFLGDMTGQQEVRISRTSQYSQPEFIPVSGCQVQVVDESGASMVYYESEPGIYRGFPRQDFLVQGRRFKLMVSDGGRSYESSYQELLGCAPVGEVYYNLEPQETVDPEITLQGIRFYTDFVIPEGYAENYRWELEETWEYHSPYPITWYWDGWRVLPPGSVPQDLYYCWSTQPVKKIITATTRLSDGLAVKGQPLHYVSNETDRLKVRYSLLIRQYALSKDAYEYWRKLEKLSQEGGGLYESQPPQSHGNMRNTENPDEVVLGWFSVSGMDEKRIFVEEDFRFFVTRTDCKPFLPLGGYPMNNAYYLVEHEGALMMASEYCFDCTQLGGTTIKPDFWD